MAREAASTGDRDDRDERADLDEARSPRERYLTVFGKVAVVEALHDLGLPVARVFVATDADRAFRRQVEELASGRGVAVRRVGRDRVTRLSGTGKQHQGVAADIEVPQRQSLQGWLRDLPGDGHHVCALLDGVTTPANVGMIIRSAAGAGLEGVIIPSRGVADIGPLVIKASAGLAFRSPLLRVRTAVEGAQLLRQSQFEVVALEAEGDVELWDLDYAPCTAFVLGGEHGGVSPEVGELVTQRVRIPMAPDVESLNVAAAATVAFFDARRRWMMQPH